MDKSELIEKIKDLEPWHHRVEVEEGIFTAEKGMSNPHGKWKVIESFIPKDLTGKTVLDLGGNEGYYSIQMKKRGASKVVMVEHAPHYIRQAKFLSDYYNVSYDIVRDDVQKFILEMNERFDFVLYLGLFYHLKYGVLVLDRLSDITKSKLFFQSATIGPPSHILESKFSTQSKNPTEEILTSPDFPKVFFLERGFKDENSSWWLGNESALIAILRTSGFKIMSHPNQGFFVCEPDKNPGSQKLNDCFFPGIGRRR